MTRAAAIKLMNAMGWGKPGRHTRKRIGKQRMTPIRVAAAMVLLLSLAAPLPYISTAYAAPTLAIGPSGSNGGNASGTTPGTGGAGTGTSTYANAGGTGAVGGTGTNKFNPGSAGGTGGDGYGAGGYGGFGVGASGSGSGGGGGAPYKFGNAINMTNNGIEGVGGTGGSGGIAIIGGNGGLGGLGADWQAKSGVVVSPWVEVGGIAYSGDRNQNLKVTLGSVQQVLPATGAPASAGTVNAGIAAMSTANWSAELVHRGQFSSHTHMNTGDMKIVYRW